MKDDYFHVHLEWSEGSGGTTLQYERYRRSHQIKCPGKPPIEMSAPPQYLGDADRLSPEELFTASLASSQMLTYLALSTRAGIRVLSYIDEAEGILPFDGGKIRIRRVILRPRIVIAAGSEETARLLVEKAHAQCFIANSVNTEVILQPKIIIG